MYNCMTAADLDVTCIASITNTHGLENTKPHLISDDLKLLALPANCSNYKFAQSTISISLLISNCSTCSYYSLALA